MVHRLLGPLCVASLALVPAAVAQSPDTPVVPGQTADEERDLTTGELQRAIDEVRRLIEEIHARAEGRSFTDDEQGQLRELQAKLDGLEAQKNAAEAEAQDKARKGGKSIGARWRRMRLAVQDMTHYDVKDGMFRIKLGIRYQVDGTAAGESDALAAAVGSIDDGVDFRRGEVFALGRLIRRLDFRFQYDFGVDDGFKDVYLEGAKFTKHVKWRIGHFKEPFSLGRQIGSNYTAFLEPALPVQAFAPGHNWGLMLRHTEVQTRLFWAVSVTTNGKTTDENRGNSKVTLTGRISGLPMYRDEGRKLVHVGLSYSARNPKDDTQRFAARPEARFAPFFVDTGLLETSEGQLFGVEAATVQGPLWVQAEWITARSDTPSVGRERFDGSYVEAGWFVTGESRFYRTDEGTFDRLTPNERFEGGNPFTGRGKGGALEATARVSTVDLNDGAVTGGEMTDVGLGLNWYPTAATRLMLNYVRADLKSVGAANVVLLRYQFNP